MYSLFIDTHSQNIVLILYKDGKLINQKTKYSSKSHSVYVINLLDELLTESKVSKNDIEELFVVNGPGSFTGIRIGITIAKTWAFTKQKKIKVINSLELIAANIEIKEKTVGIKDNKGAYIGEFNNDQKYYYVSNEELKTKGFKEIYFEDEINIDYNKVYNYLLNKPFIHPHTVNPIYIKKIGVEND